MSPDTDSKLRQTTKGKYFGSPTKELAKRAGGSSKDTLAVITSSTKRKTPQGQKLAGQRLLLANKDLVIPAEATWSSKHGDKRAWEKKILKQPGGNEERKSGHLIPTEIAGKCANWKSLLDNIFLDGATRDIKGEDETYKLACHNALGGLLVFTHFFDKKRGAFAKDPCFMVIVLPSTGLDGPDITLTADEVWGEDKLVHLSGLPVTDTVAPLSPAYGTVGSECILGMYPVPVRYSILKTPLVWCMSGDVVFSVGSAPHKGSVDNEFLGWLGVSEPKEIEYHRETLSPPSAMKRQTRAYSTSYRWFCHSPSTTASPSVTL
jgi:hypothetical protein